MFTWKKKLLTKSRGYFSSIYDCPVYAWEKAKEYNNTSFLKPEYLNVSPKDVPLDENSDGDNVFLELLEEIFLEFGINKTLLDEAKIKKQLLKAYLDHSLTGDRNILNTVNVLKNKLEDISSKKGDEKEVVFGEELAIVSKGMGGGVMNPKKTTVFEYYSAKTIVSNGE
tara:strand:+ start:1269 stop:1775 length:507 start_codon:yes stop_codon:yes gene_type:complete